MRGLCYFYLNFYISHVVFMFNIRGVEELPVFISRWTLWGCGIFIQVINVWHRASVKTASMSKQRKLRTYWFVLVGNKRDHWFQLQV
uniref:Uncharacterized protein n=1 Tax=Gorilla gorilla gorilla TaxID=9595 RepID=A0A2I2ZEJ3_GORGO